MSERQKAGLLPTSHADQTVTIKGWVQKRRDLGGLIFADIRDRSRIVQVVFNPDVSKEALETAEQIRSEFVVSVTGKVVEREDATKNQNMATGEIEVVAEEISILNKAKSPAFQIEDNIDASEDVRLKYRYLDLRRKPLQETFRLRHQATQAIRNFLNEEEFYEMETPMLTKSTPEGARLSCTKPCAPR